MGYVVGFADVPSWSFMVVDAMKSVWQIVANARRYDTLEHSMARSILYSCNHDDFGGCVMTDIRKKDESIGEVG